MKNKLLVLIGPPASGKSTFAREFIKGETDWVIASRDSFRNGRGDYWIESQEDYITKLEDFAIKEAMRSNLNVIIDDTNLSKTVQEKWKSFASEFDYELETKEFYVPFKVALERDTERKKNGADHSVGKTVLERFYRRYYPNEYAKEMRMIDDRIIAEPDESKPDCIICDLDGTVAIRREERGAFEYEKVKNDLFDPRMKRLLEKFIKQGVHIVFLSGREDINNCYSDSLEWLKTNLPCITEKSDSYEFHMRENGDHRPDDIVKNQLYNEYIKDKFNVLCIFDDRDKVVKMWRDKGLLCNQVYYGDF